MNERLINTATRLSSLLWVRIAFGVAVTALLIVLPLISSRFINYQLSLMAVWI